VNGSVAEVEDSEDSSQHNTLHAVAVQIRIRTIGAYSCWDGGRLRDDRRLVGIHDDSFR
jgi:hypothetical protein